MLDIGWSEMAVIALVALVVIGPRDLPRVMRTIGQWMRKARAMTREFQSSVDEMIREADLEDVKQAIGSSRNVDVNHMLEQTLDPTGSVRREAEDIEASARDRGSEGARNTPKVEGRAGAAAGEAAPEAPAEGEAATKAAVVKEPLRVAPPHSLKPPTEAKEAEQASSAATEAPAEPASGQKSA